MIDFKNIPNTKGEVEIGYGLGKKHEHFGYMTEAVGAFCAWGKKQNEVRCIILQRCGFVECFRDKTIWWKL